MKKIFITGSEGFIGSHLVERLVKENYRVTALIKYNFKNDIGWLKYLDNKTLKKIKIVSGDITDYGFLEQFTKNFDCIIGVSGGKDSTRQALWIRDKLKLRPLLVCMGYPPEKDNHIGAQNLSNLINLGFDVHSNK